MPVSGSSGSAKVTGCANSSPPVLLYVYYRSKWLNKSPFTCCISYLLVREWSACSLEISHMYKGTERYSLTSKSVTVICKLEAKFFPFLRTFYSVLSRELRVVFFQHSKAHQLSPFSHHGIKFQKKLLQAVFPGSWFTLPPVLLYSGKGYLTLAFEGQPFLPFSCLFHDLVH